MRSIEGEGGESQILTLAHKGGGKWSIDEDEEVFNLYVKENFPRLFDYYLKNNRYVPCYFCEYCSKSQILKIIEVKSDCGHKMKTQWTIVPSWNHEIKCVNMYNIKNMEEWNSQMHYTLV